MKKNLTKKLIERVVTVSMVVIIYGINFLPYRRKLVLGKWIGRLLLKYSRKLRNVTKINLSLSFPTLSKNELAQLSIKIF